MSSDDRNLDKCYEEVLKLVDQAGEVKEIPTN